MKPKLLALSVFALIVAITAVVDAFARNSYEADVRSSISSSADNLARDLSDVIARETASVETLAAFVNITRHDPAHMADNFPTFAQTLQESGEMIRSIQLAPGSVIRLVHPLEGNEAAVGLDLLADPDRRAILEPAIENGDTVVQGPVELVQGGLGILVRKPIYNEDGSYWGLAAVLLDWPSVAEQTNLNHMAGGQIAGARLPDMDRVIAGSEAAFEGDPIIEAVRIGATDTLWEIAVRPEDGWPTTAPLTWAIWIAGIIGATFAAMATYWLAVRPEVLRNERERAKSELAFAEARYHATFEHAGVGIAITDRKGTILSANSAVRDMIGLTGEGSMKGMNGRDLVHPLDRQEHDTKVRELLTGASVVRAEVRTVGQQERWCRISITMIDGRYQDRLFVTIIEDVTDRRTAEIELAKSESKFRQLYEHAPIAIQREDHSSVVATFNRLRAEGVEDIREYLAGSPGRLEEILEGVKIIDANPAANLLQGHLERSDGDLTLLDRMTKPTYQTFVETLVAIWNGEPTLEQSVETIGPDGSPKFLDVRWHALETGTAPDYANLFVTIADITELREAQRRLEDLIESKDRFLASVAHELRTPLTAVVGFAQELEDVAGLYSEREKSEFRELIAFHSAELSNIIEDLLIWARSDIGEVRVIPERIDLGESVRKSLTTIKGLELHVAEPDGPVEAYVDPARLRQIVRNLATNAFRYGGDHVAVRVRSVDGHADVEVRDNGPRLGKATMRRIFEPYSRSDTGLVAPGSIGLGLTVSRSLARLQGGDLVCVREGDYNVFRVSLPIAPDQELVQVG